MLYCISFCEEAVTIENDELIYRRFLAERNEDDRCILLDRHKESLILFLNSYVHNLEDAEELMIDAFAEAAAGKAVFYGKSTFKTWLFSIGKKKAITHLRKAKRHPDAWELLADLDGAVPPPELQTLQAERNRQLYSALSRLNGDYRQVLALLYFEEMSNEELCKVLGKSKKQIYNLVERARKALKEELERMGFEYAQFR